jgi:hypothetical protein
MRVLPAFAPLATCHGYLMKLPARKNSLAEYEARLNHFYKTNRALGLCQYNRNKLPNAALDHGIATRPYIRMEGPILLENPFYEPPEPAAKRSARPNDGKRRLDILKRGGQAITAHQQV